MKKYVIMVAKQFPAYHPRKGEPTNFRQQIIEGTKIHTIRANYPLWQKRFEKINSGEACIVLREWEGRPRQSKQVDIMTLTKEDGIGLEKALLFRSVIVVLSATIEDSINVSLAHNDGLMDYDFTDWFEPYNLNEPMALIHFTKFRYGTN